MGAEDAKSLIAEMRSVAEEAFGKDAAKIALPFKVDPDSGEYVFKVKSKYQPRFVNAAGQNVDAATMPPVYGGSTARIAGSIQSYDKSGNKGITLQLPRFKC